MPKYKLTLKHCSNQLDEINLDENVKKLIYWKNEIELECTLNYRNKFKRSTAVLKPESHYFLLIVGCENCDQIILIQRINDQKLISLEYVYRQKILLVMSNFEAKTDKEESKIESSKVNKVNNENKSIKSNKKNTIELKTKKNENNGIDWTNVKTSNAITMELINLIQNIENALKNTNNNLVCHYSMKNQWQHLIKAMLISESFVGLNTEAELNINLDKQLDKNEEKSIDSIFETISLTDDDDYVKLLDNYEQKTLNNVDNNSDAPELDLSIDSQIDELLEVNYFNSSKKQAATLNEESANLTATNSTNTNKLNSIEKNNFNEVKETVLNLNPMNNLTTEILTEYEQKLNESVLKGSENCVEQQCLDNDKVMNLNSINPEKNIEMDNWPKSKLKLIDDIDDDNDDDDNANDENDLSNFRTEMIKSSAKPTPNKNPDLTLKRRRREKIEKPKLNSLNKLLNYQRNYRKTAPLSARSNCIESIMDLIQSHSNINANFNEITTADVTNNRKKIKLFNRSEFQTDKRPLMCYNKCSQMSNNSGGSIKTSKYF